MGKRRSIYFAVDVDSRIAEIKTLKGVSLNKVVNELCRLGYDAYGKRITTSVEALMEDINQRIKDVKKVIRGIDKVKDVILKCGAFSSDYEEALWEGIDPSQFIDASGRLKRRRKGLKELKREGKLSDDEEEAIKYLMELRKELAHHLVWLVLQHKRLSAKKDAKRVTVQIPLEKVK